jgi:hypothetical protein
MESERVARRRAGFAVSCSAAPDHLRAPDARNDRAIRTASAGCAKVPRRQDEANVRRVCAAARGICVVDEKDSNRPAGGGAFSASCRVACIALRDRIVVGDVTRSKKE